MLSAVYVMRALQAELKDVYSIFRLKDIFTVLTALVRGMKYLGYKK
jgi:hypothetical protein